MKRKILGVLKYVFFLGIGFFLVWWQFNKMTAIQKFQFGESLRYGNYWLLVPIIILALLSHISRAVRWKILMEPMGYRPSTSNTFYSVMCGYLVNTFLPRVGEVVKCTLLNRYEKIPTNKLIGTILVERAFDLVCYLLLILITILIQIRQVSSFLRKKLSEMESHGNIPIWVKLLFIAALIFLLARFVKWIFKKFERHPHIISVKGFHIGIKEGFGSIIRLKNRGWFIFHTLFIWSMYLLEIFIGFSALSATAHLGFTEACSVLSLATLGMIVSPGGIGAFPLAVQEVLLIYHVDNVSFGWIIWGVSTGIILLGGLISFGLLVYNNKKTNEAKQTNSAQNI